MRKTLQMELDRKLKEKFEILLPLLNEKQRRIALACEARYIGYGGIKQVVMASGFSKPTIINAIKEIKTNTDIIDTKTIRKAGGGRKPIVEKDPELLVDLDNLISPETRGDPMSPLRWCCKSTRNIEKALKDKGHKISYRVIGEILKNMGYSLQSNRKTDEGKQHPDRDEQFHYINDTVKAYIKQGQPVISVDCKKKELIGNYKNIGSEWQPEGNPEKVKVYDFVDKEKGKAAPYGIFDIKNNEGWVNVGISSDTAQFAVNSIRTWWNNMGQESYPNVKQILITADGGGSNGSRNRLWKKELQSYANETGLEVTVCHLPPGTSKWNKIEHRLFSYISMNWRGKPLISIEVIVNLIASTKTKEGLRVKTSIDKRSYQTGIKVTDKEFNEINIEKNEFHGEWNYKIKPKR